MLNRAVRVAHILPTLAPGGLWRHVFNLTRLSPNDCESTVISLFQDPRGPAQPLPRRLRLISLNIDPTTHRDRVAISGRIREVLRAIRPDVAHSYHYFTDLYAIPAAAQEGVVAVRSVHGIMQLSASDGFRKTSVRHDWSTEEIAQELELEPLCERTIVVASHLSRQLVGYGIPRDKITVLLDGVDTRYFRESFRVRARKRVRRWLGISDDVIVIGFIGRLEPVKNPLMLLEIFERLVPRKRFHFVVVGDGPLGKVFSEHLAEAGAGMSFTVLNPTRHIRLAYAAFDVLLMTSLSEGCPNVALEAMAQSLPVVAPAIGGLPEILTDGLDTFLFPSGDVEAATDRLMSLFGGSRDVATMGVGFRTVAQARFSLTVRQQRLLAIYRMAAENRIAPGSALPDDVRGSG